VLHQAAQVVSWLTHPLVLWAAVLVSLGELEGLPLAVVGGLTVVLPAVGYVVFSRYVLGLPSLTDLPRRHRFFPLLLQLVVLAAAFRYLKSLDDWYLGTKIMLVFTGLFTGLALVATLVQKISLHLLGASFLGLALLQISLCPTDWLTTEPFRLVLYVAGLGVVGWARYTTRAHTPLELGLGLGLGLGFNLFVCWVSTRF
jgi:hypothetical protein